MQKIDRRTLLIGGVTAGVLASVAPVLPALDTTYPAVPEWALFKAYCRGDLVFDGREFHQCVVTGTDKTARFTSLGFADAKD